MNSCTRNSKKTIVSLFIKLGIIILSVFAFSMAGLGLYSICEKYNYDGCYKYKLDLLKSVPQNTQKAVFIGGSGTNFGINAETFEKETGIKAINMGFSAGRSFDMYIESVKPYINDGDYLFIAPELGTYNGSFHTVNTESMMFYEYQNSKSLRILNFNDFINYCKYTIQNGWTGWFNSLSYGSKTLIQDVLHYREPTIYDKWECNENGDFTLHKDRKPQPFSTSRGVSSLSNKSFIQDLNYYVVNWNKEVAFKPYIMFTPLDETTVANVEDIKKMCSDIDELTDIELLFTQDQSLYPHDYFFDTMFHLQYKYSVEEYTPLVINSFLEKQSTII